MKRATRWWLVFTAGNLIVAAALVWTSVVVIRLERSELRARAETDYQESLRLALWRMDSWLSLFLAREAARPRTEYRTDGLTPSPLLMLESDYLLLHFEVDSRGEVTSPQVSSAGFDNSSRVSDEQRLRWERQLKRWRPYLHLDAVQAAVVSADTLVNTKLAKLSSPPPSASDAEWSETQLLKTQNEFDARVACTVPRPPGTDSAGRQVIAWLDAPSDTEGEPALVFLRRMGSGGAETYQGFILDWPRLAERLLFEIKDLFPVAELERAASATAAIDPLGRGLANVPVTLVTPAPAVVHAGWVTPGRTILGLAWLAVIGAAVALGSTLRKSIDLGERRRRFVSAVTHELRTPLTTFQLYSEMLADGVVPTEEKRLEYLRTLKDEAQRLSAMVGNVLAHARLEERGSPRRLESMSLGNLLSRVRPPLERRAEAAGMTLEIESKASDSAPLTADVEAIGQILANLVDNAAKYANDIEPPTIRLDAAARNGSLILTVRDHGPGVPREHAAAIFAPFERGGRDASDPVPGVGLGLALSRDLARDMGGDLTLEPTNDRGALFRLVLPKQSV